MKEVLNTLIFKTNIRLKKDLVIIAPLLTACNYIKRWTIDRQDIDNVLRIVSTLNNPVSIIQTVNSAGYHCEELAD